MILLPAKYGILGRKFQADPEQAFHEMTGLWISPYSLETIVEGITFRISRDPKGPHKYEVWSDSEHIYTYHGKENQRIEFMADLLCGAWHQTLFA